MSFVTLMPTVRVVCSIPLSPRLRPRRGSRSRPSKSSSRPVASCCTQSDQVTHNFYLRMRRMTKGPTQDRREHSRWPSHCSQTRCPHHAVDRLPHSLPHRRMQTVVLLHHQFLSWLKSSRLSCPLRRPPFAQRSSPRRAPLQSSVTTLRTIKTIRITFPLMSIP